MDKVKTCSIENCGKPARKMGWCYTHYSRWYKFRDPMAITQPKQLNPELPICTVDGCGKRQQAFGLCCAHYTRKRRHGDAFGGRTARGEPMEWINSHLSHDGDECLIWPYALARGYGVLVVDGRMRVASNYMCELLHGPAPEGQEDAAHSCGKGNKGCVNPRHLRWASRSDNCNEKLAHGTMTIGEQSHMAKMTEKQVRDIRALRAKGVPVGELAAKFSMSRAGIYLILNKTNWRWVA